MKFFAFFLLGFVCVQALTPAEKAKVDGYFDECGEQSGVEESALRKIKGGDFNFDDVNAKKFIVCMFKRVGLMNEAGELQREESINKVEESLRAEVRRIFDLCVQETGDNLEDRVWNYCKCYERERPGQEDFF